MSACTEREIPNYILRDFSKKLKLNITIANGWLTKIYVRILLKQLAYSISNSIEQIDYELEISITSKKSRAINLNTLVELLLHFSANNGFQLFLNVLFKFAPYKDRRD